MNLENVRGVKVPVFNTDILNIIHEYNLWKIFYFIVENNPSNFAPYHGIRHTLHVMKAAHDIYWNRLHNECDLCDCDDCAWYDFYSTSEDLVIAALFHDFNHSQGVYTDKGNVDDAIKGAVDFMTYRTPYSLQKIERIASIIRATEYPYSEANNINILSEIIRDADLSQSASDDFLFYVMGLMQENNDSRDGYEDIHSFKTIIENTIKFNKANKFFLPETEEIYGEQRKRNIQMLENLLEYGRY